MQKIFCDLCGKETWDSDVRYIEFYKIMAEGDKNMCHSKLEVCPECMENSHKKVVKIDTDSDSK